MPVVINGTTGITTPATVIPEGQSYPIVLGTAVASTSGTLIDYLNIPSWVKRITVMFNLVSSSSTTHWQIQIGTAAGVQNSGYASSFGYAGAGSAQTYTMTTGFGMYNDTASDLRHGAITLSLLDASNGTWVCSGVTAWSTRSYMLPTSGVKTLSGILDRVRITTVGGAETFDAGSVNILYE
jgi:hypothetical protein